ncbi:hypothetical protein ACFVWR_18340 [Leifsonia sp. NPDC058292]|uniref:hypothetical protein n=1 Tax=Leifsonia sp. NPDC058292 TaxID=3346428 RepID=UPI0036DD5D55
MTALPSHPLVLADLTEGKRTIAWDHPSTCTDHANCEIVRRLKNAINGDWFDLTTELTPGIYMVGDFGFHGITFVDDDDRTFDTEADIRPVTRHGLNLPAGGIVPFGCAWCGTPKRQHGRRWDQAKGMHSWEQPSQEQTWLRMLARRATRQSPRRQTLTAA